MINWLLKGEDPVSSWDGKLNDYMLQGLTLLQKYGVMATLMVFLACMVLRYIAKIQKNTRLQQTWLMLAIGMISLCLVLIFLPYIVLHFLES